MWIYSQSTGHLWDPSGEIVATGYSGKGTGKNNPDAQSQKFHGPIPRGLWVIGKPYNSENVGPFALPLTPVLHDALGRTDFLIHGDSINFPGEASEGCIILPRTIRECIAHFPDDTLMVIE